MTSQAKTTVTSMSTASFLSPGTFIMCGNKKFKILATNKVNYRVIDEDGVSYNLKRHAQITVIEAKDFKSTIEEIEQVDYEPGTPVRIRAGKFAGVQGMVCKVNANNFHVVVENMGIISVSKTVVEVITKEVPEHREVRSAASWIIACACGSRFSNSVPGRKLAVKHWEDNK